MIGESVAVTTQVYQEQVSRENQIQRDQGAAREVEDNSSRQATADVTSFSVEGLELARAAVSALEEPAEVDVDQRSDEAAPPPESRSEGSSPAQYLDVQA